MPAVVIENPIINPPFEEPRCHLTFDENGITDKIAESRQPSAYFIPIAQPRKKERQLTLKTQWTLDRIKDNDDINFVRGRVKLWRDQEYPDITPVTRLLLEHWKDTEREYRRFFCQIEALETMIYLTEAAASRFSIALGTALQRPARRFFVRLARWRPPRARRLSWPC